MAGGKSEAVRDGLLERLEAMRPGTLLPPERRLAPELGVSRMTLRRVLDELVRTGRLVREPGRGTLVPPPKMHQPLALTSFTDDMRRRGLTPGSRTLSADRVLAGARLGRRLSVSPGEPLLSIVRLRLADGIPMAIEVLTTPVALVPGLTGRDLEQASFYETLANRYGIVVVGGVQTIEPTVTDELESSRLGVPLHSPAFLFERTSRDADGRVVEFVRSVYRGDRYQIVTPLARGDQAGDVPPAGRVGPDD